MCRYRDNFHPFVIIRHFQFLKYLNKFENTTYQRKNGNQHARKAETIIPNVLAAFLSLFILLLVPGSGGGGADFSSAINPSSTDCRSDVNPADIPLICRCLLSRAAATLLLQQKNSLTILMKLNCNTMVTYVLRSLLRFSIMTKQIKKKACFWLSNNLTSINHPISVTWFIR